VAQRERDQRHGDGDDRRDGRQLDGPLGVLPSPSRPHVSDDNPFSEAQFKTLKYRPDFPARFGAYEDAETFCQRFFPWYNTEQLHQRLAGRILTLRGRD